MFCYKNLLEIIEFRFTGEFFCNTFFSQHLQLNFEEFQLLSMKNLDWQFFGKCFRLISLKFLYPSSFFMKVLLSTTTTSKTSTKKLKLFIVKSVVIFTNVGTLIKTTDLHLFCNTAPIFYIFFFFKIIIIILQERYSARKHV